MRPGSRGLVQTAGQRSRAALLHKNTGTEQPANSAHIAPERQRCRAYYPRPRPRQSFSQKSVCAHQPLPTAQIFSSRSPLCIFSNGVWGFAPWLRKTLSRILKKPPHFLAVKTKKDRTLPGLLLGNFIFAPILPAPAALPGRRARPPALPAWHFADYSRPPPR